jgi:hypothetical protein
MRHRAALLAGWSPGLSSPYSGRIAASGDDGSYIDGTGLIDDGDNGNAGEFDSALRGQWLRFVDCGIPSGATITTAYLTVYINTFSAGALTKIAANDVQSPTNPTNEADYEGRVRTTAQVDWDGPGDTGSGETSPELKTIVQELVDSYGDIDTILLLHDDDGSDGAWINYRHYDENPEEERPLLYVEWT